MQFSGLTQAQVREQIRKGRVNYKTDSGTKSVREILRSNIFTYFNLIFIILGILLVIARSFNDLSFLLVIAGNSAIGIFQELRSKSVLDKMNLMTEPRVFVVREGKEQQIRSEQIVLGDFLHLSAGSQVPADATVLSGMLRVNESMLTGEADEIEKYANDDLMAGSVIISGDCIARTTAVGTHTYAAKLTKEATRMEDKEESEIFRSLDKMLRFFGILIIPLGIILFFEQYRYSHLGFSSSVSGTVAALIGMIPEGIYLLTSVALAVSATRLAGKKVLTHDLKCIETLSRVDVLCLDKTGTITSPQMDVAAFELLVDSKYEPYIMGLLGDYAQSSTDTNETMNALRAFFENGHGYIPQDSCAFSSQYKYGSQTINGRHFVLGAPEYVLGQHYEKHKELVALYSEKGGRVVAFAEYTYLPKGEMLNEAYKLLPLALIVLENPIRPGAPTTFKYFKKQGVEVKVISGDHPLTVSRVAMVAGIENADRYIDVSAIESKRELHDAAKNYTVFGRVSPERKKMLIAALQRQGHKVAMTGDGVNDIIAMKQADCSIAMASGSDAAAQASQLVLMDSDFSRMPSIVDEGRRVINNIQRAASLYLVKNIFSLFLAVFSVILMLNYPLNPAQLTLISLFTIGIPSFVIALEPNKERIHGHFMRNVLIKALPAGITDFLVVSALVLFCVEFSVDKLSVSTASSVIVAIVGFMILLRTIEHVKFHHYIMLMAVVAGWLICLTIFPSFFGISKVSRQCFLLLVIFAVITEPLLRYLGRLFAWLDRRLRNRDIRKEKILDEASFLHNKKRPEKAAASVKHMIRKADDHGKT